MSNSINRTFSFNNDDETSLHSDGQRQSMNRPPPHEYDVPSRNTQVSPLPPAYEYESRPPRPHTVSPPSPPPHRVLPASSSSISPPRRPVSTYPQDPAFQDTRQRNLGHSSSDRSPSTTTPGMDNLGTAAAGGGIAGLALGVANTNERASGVEAVRSQQDLSYPGHDPTHESIGTDSPYVPQPPYRSQGLESRGSNGSTAPLAAAPASFGHLTPLYNSSIENVPIDGNTRDPHRQSSYTDGPYNRFTSAWDPRVEQGEFDPNNIDDDGDEGIVHQPARRRSMLGLGPQSERTLPKGVVAAGVAGGATGGFLGGLGGLVGRKGNGAGSRDASGNYGPVPGQGSDGGNEKLELMADEASRRRRFKWTVSVLAILVLAAIVAGAVIGGMKAQRGSNASMPVSNKSAADDDGGGDLTKDSAEIKKLLGNNNLHKVFPGMDYTPFNAQYPDCLSNPPSQNNVTRDMAVLSQLTNQVRLYGTDCNQTAMVLHSIAALGITDMKIWLGVWLENNATTNDRQIGAMYDILTNYTATPFAGVIVGNEVLYRKDMTEEQLGTILTGVKSNFTDKKYDLPVATSDLGDNWTADLASNVDIVMSNVHPFFAGTPVDQAAGWTYDFWQSHDVVLTQGTTKQNYISEVGWPSDGGNDCGAASCTSATQGSIAGIDEMNTFMGDFVCQSLTNKTNYFWFEAFDEPWKVQFNTPTENWEDKWGLMDAGRNLKSGLKIPDCGGQTV